MSSKSGLYVPDEEEQAEAVQRSMIILDVNKFMVGTRPHTRLHTYVNIFNEPAFDKSILVHVFDITHSLSSTSCLLASHIYNLLLLP